MINKVTSATQCEEMTINRPIHYLGSKLRILQQIKEVIDCVEPTNGMVCDLFAGSGTVANFLAESRLVIASDIQEYSKVICEALLLPMNETINVEQFMLKCRNSIHTIKLFDTFKELIDYERDFLKNVTTFNINGLYEIIEEGSIITYELQGNKSLSSELKKLIVLIENRLVENNWISLPQAMMTRYYGGLYFSYLQTVCMDAILEQIFLLDNNQKTLCLAALLSTASEVVNTIGKQFAQPLKVRDSNGKYKLSLKNKIIDDRGMDVFSIYEKWLNKYIENKKNNYLHEVYTMNYTDVLNRLKDKNVKAIYADPPYTRYHYSRYYHILETMCLRDNPIVSTKFANGKGGISRGIYRNERHQSVFSIKSKAENAFKDLFYKTRSLDVPLILSYSPFEPSQAVTPRLQTIDQLVDMAKLYFSDVTIVSPGNFTHSKLNCVEKNFDSNNEAELLIICK